MRIHPQTIYNKDEPEFVVLPIKEYKALIIALEDYKDIQEIKKHEASNSETFPLALAQSLSEGENPIKTFRKHRKLSQEALASKVGVSKQYISQLESFKREGSPTVLNKIAKALKVDLSDILL